MNISPAKKIYHTLYLTTTIGCPLENNISSHTILDSQKCLSIVYINAAIRTVSSIPFDYIYIVKTQWFGEK